MKNWSYYFLNRSRTLKGIHRSNHFSSIFCDISPQIIKISLFKYSYLWSCFWIKNILFRVYRLAEIYKKNNTTVKTQTKDKITINNNNNNNNNNSDMFLWISGSAIFFCRKSAIKEGIKCFSFALMNSLTFSERKFLLQSIQGKAAYLKEISGPQRESLKKKRP